MKIATFTHDGRTRIGKIVGDVIVDLSIAMPALPIQMEAFLEQGAAALEAVRNVTATVNNSLPLAEVVLESPVQRPRKFLAVGFNFRDHVEEVMQVPAMKNFKLPEVPVFFNKQVTCVNAPYGTFELPAASDQLDYEVELAVVIGERCRNVPADRAVEVIAGYCVCNDVSIRDWQLASPTTTMGKSWDTHGPLGPWITTPDEIDPAKGLWLRTWVNGELRQDGHTRSMIHSIGRQIEYLSTAFTLEPGDVIITGTPAGVGVLMNPQVFLKEGDVVRVEVEGLGHLEHTVAREAA